MTPPPTGLRRPARQNLLQAKRALSQWVVRGDSARPAANQQVVE